MLVKNKMQPWLIIIVILILLILYITVWQRDGYNSSRSNSMITPSPETLRAFIRHQRDIDHPWGCSVGNVWQEQTAWEGMRHPEPCVDRNKFALGEEFDSTETNTMQGKMSL